ncbi:prepilin-type N-terminal cleavage/methylation domain-containing protein [Candidatus Saccharibacteria bacterium]|nr:prepilin-type N-terminal cleavage/methylation domain-containing protein [Candidatus Saccharibacteria bacterium]
MAHKLRRDNGFTIVELLIVIVVIGILAAIALVSYTSARNRSYDAAVQNDLKGLAKSMEAFRADRGRYPNSDAELLTLKVKVTFPAYRVQEVNVAYCTTATFNAFAVTAQSNSGKKYKVVSGALTPVEYTASDDGVSQADPYTCNDVLTGSERLRAGFYIYDNPQWRSWVGSGNL